MKTRWYCPTGQHWVTEPIHIRCAACRATHPVTVRETADEPETETEPTTNVLDSTETIDDNSFQKEITMTMTNDLVFNRFKSDSVAGRMLRALMAGKPLSVAQVARVARPKSVDNILAPGGWYALLRRYGKTSRKFNLAKTEDGKLVMKVNARYAKVSA